MRTAGLLTGCSAGLPARIGISNSNSVTPTRKPAGPAPLRARIRPAVSLNNPYLSAGIVIGCTLPQSDPL